MKTRIAGRRVFHGVCAVSPWGLRRRSIVHGLAAALGAELITISGLAVPAALAAAAGPEGAASDPASASWLATVESRIAEEEYHLTWQTQIALPGDRKSTRLNSSHVRISYAVFCLKKKKNSFFVFYFLKKKKKK